VDRVYWLLFSVAGLVLTGGCGPFYRWVGPGTEQQIAQVRDQCGGDYFVIGPGELGRIGTGGSGEPDPSPFTEYQAKKTPLALSRYRRFLFIKCMESEGYKLEPVAGRTKEPMQEILIKLVLTSSIAATQQIYKWKDYKGQWHFSDNPPPEIRAEKVKGLDIDPISPVPPQIAEPPVPSGGSENREQAVSKPH